MVDKHKIQNMALDVSYRCEWNGEDICAVFLEALTDANFHTLRETLEKEIKKEFERIDKAVL
jgi:hypothetical protein